MDHPIMATLKKTERKNREYIFQLNSLTCFKVIRVFSIDCNQALHDLKQCNKYILESIRIKWTENFLL